VNPINIERVPAVLNRAKALASIREKIHELPEGQVDLETVLQMAEVLDIPLEQTKLAYAVEAGSREYFERLIRENPSIKVTDSAVVGQLARDLTEAIRGLDPTTYDGIHNCVVHAEDTYSLVTNKELRNSQSVYARKMRWTTPLFGKPKPDGWEKDGRLAHILQWRKELQTIIIETYAPEATIAANQLIEQEETYKRIFSKTVRLEMSHTI